MAAETTFEPAEKALIITGAALALLTLIVVVFTLMLKHFQTKMKPAFEGGVFNTVPPPESRVSIVHHNPSKLSSVEDFEGWGGTETALTVAEDPVAWSSTVPAVDARPVLEGEDNFSLQAQTKIWEDLQAAERKAKARQTASISIEEADGYLDSETLQAAAEYGEGYIDPHPNNN